MSEQTILRAQREKCIPRTCQRRGRQNTDCSTQSAQAREHTEEDLSVRIFRYGTPQLRGSREPLSIIVEFVDKGAKHNRHQWQSLHSTNKIRDRHQHQHEASRSRRTVPAAIAAKKPQARNTTSIGVHHFQSF